jgi:hypothetical protein
MGLSLKSNMIILYQITQLSEQNYKLAIPFAENDFGQWRSQTFIFGGAKRTPKARDHLGGSEGILPRENFEIWSRSMAISRVSGVRFCIILEIIYCRKDEIGSHMGSHRPPPNFYSDFIFLQGQSFSLLGGLSPPLPPPPLSTPLVVS